MDGCQVRQRSVKPTAKEEPNSSKHTHTPCLSVASGRCAHRRHMMGIWSLARQWPVTIYKTGGYRCPLVGTARAATLRVYRRQWTGKGPSEETMLLSTSAQQADNRLARRDYSRQRRREQRHRCVSIRRDRLPPELPGKDCLACYPREGESN